MKSAMRNAVNSPGLRFGLARCVGRGFGRGMGYFSSLGFNWKLSILFVSVIPPLWFFKEKKKAEKKTIVYNRAVKDCVYMDFACGSRYLGRVLIGLYTENCPLTCENFIQLAQGYKVKDKTIGYKNTDVHKIIPGIALVSGDVLFGNGQGQLSIYGPKFCDENFDMDFVQDGDVCMFNTSAHSNGSQFMITFRPQKSLFGYSVVFGTVLKGMRVIRMIEDLGNTYGVPAERIRIVKCGLYKGLEDGPPFYSMPELTERYDQGPMTSSEFSSLPLVEQEDLLTKWRQNGVTTGLHTKIAPSTIQPPSHEQQKTVEKFNQDTQK